MELPAVLFQQGQSTLLATMCDNLHDHCQPVSSPEPGYPGFAGVWHVDNGWPYVWLILSSSPTKGQADTSQPKIFTINHLVTTCWAQRCHINTDTLISMTFQRFRYYIPGTGGKGQIFLWVKLILFHTDIL